MRLSTRSLRIIFVIFGVAIFVCGSMAVRRMGSYALSVSGLKAHEELVSFDITDMSSYAGLPVGSVEKYDAPDAWARIVLIPQYHRNPSTSLSDAMNDSAERSQGEIYDILDVLHEKAHVRLVFVEGELHGPVRPEKMQQVLRHIADRNALQQSGRSLLEELKNQNAQQGLFDRIAQGLREEIAVADRDILLQGAPFVLAAQGRGLQVWGVENASAQAASRDVVREYVYVQDRLAQLQDGESVRAASSRQNFLDSRAAPFAKLLAALHGSSFQRDLAAVDRFARDKESGQLSDLAQKTRRSLDALQYAEAPAITASSGPSRAENPYEDVTSEEQLRKRLQEIEGDVEDVVIDRRNKEVAEAVAKTLRENTGSLSALEFGAGHTKGLVEELNRQGISVVVVTSREVFQNT